MRRRHQQGNVAEVIPVIVIGILLMLGVLQIALFMTGKHAAELAAYRASRTLETGADAKAEAEPITEFGYPLGETEIRTTQDSVTVRLKMKPLIGSFAALDVRAEYPIRLEDNR